MTMRFLYVSKTFLYLYDIRGHSNYSDYIIFEADQSEINQNMKRMNALINIDEIKRLKRKPFWGQYHQKMGHLAK